jgi:hypothetical protein
MNVTVLGPATVGPVAAPLGTATGTRPAAVPPPTADTVQLQAAARAGRLPAVAPAMAPPGGDVRLAPAEILGTVDYYRWRAADFARRHPDRPAPTYYMNYGDKYVHRFSEQLPAKMTPEGVQWLKRARLNLQQAIETAVRRDPRAFDRLEQDDKAFTRFAYDTHADAYRQAGIRDIPLRDWIAVGTIPDPQDLFSPAGVKQMVAVSGGVASDTLHVAQDRLSREMAVVGDTIAPHIDRAKLRLGQVEDRLKVSLPALSK